MAGSRDWFDYRSDDGTVFAVNLDESNSKAVCGGNQLMDTRSSATAKQLPRGLKMRYVNCYNTAKPLERRKFYVSSTAAITSINAGGNNITAEDYPDSLDGAGTPQSWAISSFRGERARLVPGIAAPDTGLDDGTGGASG